MTINELIAAVEATTARSAWSRGVKEYALEMLFDMEQNMALGYLSEDDICSHRLLSRALLNGASDWSQYSWGGCALCYDTQIAERLCNPTELKRTDNGRKDPNPRENWLDVQARALYQAERLILDCIR